MVTTARKTKKQIRKSLQQMKDEESDRIRNQPIEIPYQAEILKYCKEWRNLYAIAGKFDSFTPVMRGYLRQLEHEGLLVSNNEDYRASAGYPGEDWLSKERQIVQECFWVELEFVGNLIKFWIGEDRATFGEHTQEPISFEVPRNYIKTQVRKRPQLSPVDYAGAWVNIHKSKHLSLSVHEQRDEIYFVNNENKLLFFSKYDIEKTLKVDDEISPQEFFLAKANEKELKKGDRVAIIHYQFGLLEELGHDWAIASIKYPWCEIWRGDGCGDNFRKIELWRIQKCLPTANSSEELAVSPMPQENGFQTKSEQPDIAISTKARSPSTDRTSQMSPSTGISEISSQPEASTICSPSPSLVPEPATQATAKGSSIQNPDCGEKDSGLCVKPGQSSQSGSNLWELSIADYEQSLADAEWLDIKQKLKLSRREAAARHITASEYLSLPTMTANAGTANSRPSGANKLEKKFEALGLLPNGSKLSVPAMAMMMGFPANWCEAIAPSQPLTQPASPGRKEETRPESSSVKPSAHHKPALHLAECATSKPQNNNILPTEYRPIAIPAKAISLWQPWASLIGKKQKLYETRSWGTDYRGKLLICSAKRAKAEQLDKWIELSDRYGFKEEFKQLPLGYAIAICDLADCILMDDEFITQQSQLERDCGDWQPGRYAWKLDNIIAIDPQPIRGYQGLWNIDLTPYKLPTEPPKKKRGRRKGSANKKAASGSLSIRSDVGTGAGIYSYWDIETQKIKKLSVPSTLTARVGKAIAQGKSVPEIIGIIKAQALP